MHDHKQTSNETAARATAFSGVIVAVAALLGAQLVGEQTSLRAAKHAVVSTWSTAQTANPLLDSPGLFVVAGAAVLLIAWLQRQSLRNLVLALPRLQYACVHSQAKRRTDARKLSISHHIGGLHGP